MEPLARLAFASSPSSPPCLLKKKADRQRHACTPNGKCAGAALCGEASAVHDKIKGGKKEGGASWNKNWKRKRPKRDLYIYIFFSRICLNMISCLHGKRECSFGIQRKMFWVFLLFLLFVFFFFFEKKQSTRAAF